MKLVLSPSKSLDFESKVPTSRYSSPEFLSEAEKLNTILKKKSVKSLAKLMDISQDLSQLNYERNQEFTTPFTKNNSRPALFAFTGDVYRGFEVETMDLRKLPKAQDTVRILSGLYGVLRPLDLMQPYRLEMGTKMKVGRKANLYEFWKKKVTDFLNDEMVEGEWLVNLASNEYFKAVDKKVLNAPLLNIKFQEVKKGKYTTIAIYSKLARGMMARYIVDNDIESIEGIKNFDMDNYRYTEKLSSDEEFVFTR